MRYALVLMFAAAALAAPAFAQPGAARPQPVSSPVASEPAQASDKAPSQTTPASNNPEADAALAMSIRMREEAELRIARVACAAGDAAKCAVVEAAKTAKPAQ